jgi:hypothetical protein
VHQTAKTGSPVGVAPLFGVCRSRRARVKPLGALMSSQAYYERT